MKIYQMVQRELQKRLKEVGTSPDDILDALGKAIDEIEVAHAGTLGSTYATLISLAKHIDPRRGPKYRELEGIAIRLVESCEKDYQLKRRKALFGACKIEEVECPFGVPPGMSEVNERTRKEIMRDFGLES